jgi:transketolase
VADIARGGYVLADSEGGTPDLILIATGSEVAWRCRPRPPAGSRPAEDARGVDAVHRTCSTPDAEYREVVLPNAVRKRVAVEAGVTGFWRKYVGLDGAVIGIDSFGASAPAEKLFPHFGFTLERALAIALAL